MSRAEAREENRKQKEQIFAAQREAEYESYCVEQITSRWTISQAQEADRYLRSSGLLSTKAGSS